MPANMPSSMAGQLSSSAAAGLHHINYVRPLAANPGAGCRSLTDLEQHQPECKLPRDRRRCVTFCPERAAPAQAGRPSGRRPR